MVYHTPEIWTSIPILSILYMKRPPFACGKPRSWRISICQYTGKSTLLQMRGHFILSKVTSVRQAVVKWGTRGARLNAIAPGIIVTPLAIDEFNGPR